MARVSCSPQGVRWCLWQSLLNLFVERENERCDAETGRNQKSCVCVYFQPLYFASPRTLRPPHRRHENQTHIFLSLSLISSKQANFKNQPADEVAHYEKGRHQKQDVRDGRLRVDKVSVHSQNGVERYGRKRDGDLEGRQVEGQGRSRDRGVLGEGGQGGEPEGGLK